MKQAIRVPGSILFLFWMTLLLGLAYPLAVTGIAQLAFPWKANGSLLLKDGRVAGSALLAQDFRSPRYFRARPSATGYAYIGSGASNLAATNAALESATRAGEDAWKQAAGAAQDSTPAQAPGEMVHASASGLDPDISLAAALAQLDGVAAARGYTEGMKKALGTEIRRMAAESTSLIAPPRIPVTLLNLELDSDPAFAGGR